MRIVATIFALSLTLQAGMINAIAIIVGDKPITLYEIDVVMQNHRLSENEAAEFLVQRALQQIEIERLGIEVSAQEVDEQLERFARQNGLNKAQLQDMVESQGINFAQYRQEFEDNVKNRKLFERVSASRVTRPSSQALQIYYQNNIEDFKIFETAQIIQYVADSEAVLQNFMSDPFASDEGILRDRQEVNSRDLSQNLSYMIDNTPNQSFTPIVEVGGRYVAIYVESKSSQRPRDFEEVQDKVLQSFRESQQEETIKQHFQKVRANTDIKIIR